MKYDKAEVDAILVKQERESNVHKLALVEQAAVEADKLTSDPKWNIFLQQIKHRLNESEKCLKSLTAQCLSPELTDPEEKERIFRAVLMNTQDIDSLNFVINIPKSIIDDGDKAKSMLASLVDKITPGRSD